MSLSTFMRNLKVRFAWRTTTATRPTNWFVSLHTSDPVDTGANEVTAGVDVNYARVAVTFGIESNGRVLNNVAVTFPLADAVAASYTVTHFGVWSAFTGGDFYGGNPLDNSKIVIDGTILSFAIGDLLIEEV